ncbi:MAG: HAD family hydrolase [Bacilli bacterium]|nr:HAD family hydrolase [Bacilli bacterium]
MKKYSLYLFDFDGTLFDTIESLKEIYKLTFAKYGIVPTKEDYTTFITLSLPRAMKYKGIDMKYQKEFCKFFNSNVLCDSVVRKTKLYPDSMKFMKFLEKSDIKYGIVSGSSKQRVYDVLDYLKLDPNKLTVCVGNESYKHAKPNAEPIKVALKKAGFKKRKNEVVYIGDAWQDEACAKAAGVDYINIKRPHNKTGDIKSLFDLFK